jgi:putative membrane protein
VSQQAPPSRVELDSRARSHLANERTFLAWLRTGLSVVAAGLAVAGFLPPGLIPGFPYVRSYAVLLVISGALLIVIGGIRAHRTAQRINEGTRVDAPGELWVVAVLAVILCIMAIPLIFGLR